MKFPIRGCVLNNGGGKGGEKKKLSLVKEKKKKPLGVFPSKKKKNKRRERKRKRKTPRVMEFTPIRKEKRKKEPFVAQKGGRFACKGLLFVFRRGGRRERPTSAREKKGEKFLLLETQTISRGGRRLPKKKGKKKTMTKNPE